MNLLAYIYMRIARPFADTKSNMTTTLWEFVVLVSSTMILAMSEDFYTDTLSEIVMYLIVITMLIMMLVEFAYLFFVLRRKYRERQLRR